MKLYRFFSLLALLTAGICAAVHARADEPAPLRSVLSAFTAEAGSAHIAETYLSPLRYSGWTFALGYERMQAMRFNPERWVMQLNGRLVLDRTFNPAHNSSIWNVEVQAGWAMMRRFRLSPALSLYAGGRTDLDLGIFYSDRNTNNPAAAKAAWTVGVQTAAVYSTSLRKLPVFFRYQIDMPLTGVFFSPEYGELYYEIYLGNHSGLVRAAWPGNYFRLGNYLTADLRFGGTTLRLGYRCNVLSAKASDIVTRHISHTAVVGVTTEWVSLSTRRRITDAKVISALY